MARKKTSMPEPDDNAVNMTDVNGQPSAMDEDGDCTEAPEPDNTPLLQSFAVKTEHLPGQKEALTTMVALVHTRHGLVSKRMVLTGSVTARRVGQMLESVATWHG